MNKKEFEKEIDNLEKLGLVEKRIVNGETQIKITQLGKRYVELNILPKSGGEK